MSAYTQLNHGWNAEPNAPEPQMATDGDALLLTFFLSSYEFPAYVPGQTATLRFAQCARYRLGPPNDEEWYRTLFRKGSAEPPWGEFYELHDWPPSQRTDWRPGPASGVGVASGPRRHFLFYLRDAAFECEAAGWHLEVHARRSAS